VFAFLKDIRIKNQYQVVFERMNTLGNSK